MLLKPGQADYEPEDQLQEGLRDDYDQTQQEAYGNHAELLLPPIRKPSPRSTKYKACKINLRSCNKLHAHLQLNRCARPINKTSNSTKIKMKVIRSNARKKTDPQGFEFQSWHYVVTRAKLSPTRYARQCSQVLSAFEMRTKNARTRLRVHKLST